MEESREFNRVRWHSRRGMLELDLVLEPFVEKCYPGLSERQQRLYRRLLDSEDQDLYSWFLGRVRPGDAELAEIVDVVLEYTRKPA
jgi:antitoxin CptB